MLIETLLNLSNTFNGQLLEFKKQTDYGGIVLLNGISSLVDYEYLKIYIVLWKMLDVSIIDGTWDFAIFGSYLACQNCI